MKVIRLLRNAAGMGLVEVMMAVAVTGGLTLTIAKLMENSSQSAKQVEAKSENTNLKGILQDVLNNPTACNYTFGGVMSAGNVAALTSGAPTASVTVPNIKDKTNAIKYDLTSTNINPLTITSMVVTNYNSTAFTGDLLVNSTFRKSSTMTMMVKPIRIPINFSFNGATLTACSTMAVGGEWLLGGNAGTVDGTDYIGTSDNQPLNFRVNAQKAGRIDSVGQVFLGYRAGNALTSGSNNTGIGFSALLLNTTGWQNTAMGNQALLVNLSGGMNTAVGFYALRNNTANQNTALGHYALGTNTSGTQNTAVGSSAAQLLTTGSNNTAIGQGSLGGATIGSENVAIGQRSMENLTTGSSNVGIGVRALQGSSVLKLTGRFNVGIGQGAGTLLSSGEFNTLVGLSSGQNLDLGNSNIFLGSHAGTGVTFGSNNIAIGHDPSTYFSSSSSDKLYIDTNGSALPLIGGDFSSAGRYVVINGKLGIGTSTVGTPSTPVVATAGVTMLHVTGGKTILDQEAWKPIPLTAAWTACNYGGFKSAPKYFKDSTGTVHFRGCIRPTAALGDKFQSVAFSLPTGHNPDSPVAFWGPLVRRPESGMVWADLKSTSWCYLFMDGSGGPTFWVQSETAMPISDGCELHMIHYRAEN